MFCVGFESIEQRHAILGFMLLWFAAFSAVYKSIDLKKEIIHVLFRIGNTTLSISPYCDSSTTSLADWFRTSEV